MRQHADRSPIISVLIPMGQARCQAPAHGWPCESALDVLILVDVLAVIDVHEVVMKCLAENDEHGRNQQQADQNCASPRCSNGNVSQGRHARMLCGDKGKDKGRGLLRTSRAGELAGFPDAVLDLAVREGHFPWAIHLSVMELADVFAAVGPCHLAGTFREVGFSFENLPRTFVLTSIRPCNSPAGRGTVYVPIADFLCAIRKDACSGYFVHLPRAPFAMHNRAVGLAEC